MPWKQEVAGFFLPFAVCLLLADPKLVMPPLHGGAQGSSGTLAVGCALFFGLWFVLTMAMSRGGRARRLFAVLTCGVHQVGASSEANRMKRVIRMIEDNTRLLQSELKSAQEAEEGARRVRHDTRHHNDVVREMLAAGRVKEADQYLANMNSHEFLSSLGTRRWCENHLVNALLAVALAV